MHLELKRIIKENIQHMHTSTNFKYVQSPKNGRNFQALASLKCGCIK